MTTCSADKAERRRRQLAPLVESQRRQALQALRTREEFEKLYEAHGSGSAVARATGMSQQRASQLWVRCRADREPLLDLIEADVPLPEAAAQLGLTLERAERMWRIVLREMKCDRPD